MLLSGGQAVVHTLYQEGVRCVFGIPGVHNLAIYDALAEFPDLRHFVTRHEQGAAFMADGYARASGKVGVVLVTTGPGALNTLTPVLEAYGCSSPVLIISSQITSKYHGQRKGLLHEVDDQLAMFRPVTAQQRYVDVVAAIPETIHELLHGMRAGRPRPAYLEIPFDVLNKEAEVDLGRPREVIRPAATEAEVRAIVEGLGGAQRPLIVCGGGVISSGGASELLALLELAPAAVATSLNGRGAIPEDHPLACGALVAQAPIKEYIAACDFVLALGTKFCDRSTQTWTTPYSKNLIHVNIDAGEFNKNYPCRLGVAADAATVLRQVRGELTGKAVAASREVEKEISSRKREVFAALREEHPTVDAALRDLRQALPRESCLVMDMTLLSYWCRTHYEVYGPTTFVQPIGSGTLGAALPLAIGAKIARPERPVFVVCGDGGFLFTCQEYATALRYGLELPILLFNDNKYGAIEWFQQNRYDRVVDATLANPDFMKFADAFGVDGVRISSLHELPGAIRFAARKGGPVIIETSISFEPPWDPESLRPRKRVAS